MAEDPSTHWSVFCDLCRAAGGQVEEALIGTVESGRFPQLFEMAQSQDVLPVLAVRTDEKNIDKELLGNEVAGQLHQSLLENTKRNMRICAQAIKLARQLNNAGISPLFLKGTALLLSANYENIGFRKQIDIDLVVRPEEIQAAADALLAAGYKFYRVEGKAQFVPLEPGNTSSAIKLSSDHHHLPPLVHGDYAATVELHRHFLPRRFQRRIPLTLLFESARKIEDRGVTFLVPSAEYQMIHLIQGKLIHDGHMARRVFPVREACDFINILENADGHVDDKLIARHCGQAYELFAQLVAELMAYPQMAAGDEYESLSMRRRLMRQRYDSAVIGDLLDSYAKTLSLCQSLLYSPGKLPAYLRRFTA